MASISIPMMLIIISGLFVPTVFALIINTHSNEALFQGVQLIFLCLILTLLVGKFITTDGYKLLGVFMFVCGQMGICLFIYMSYKIREMNAARDRKNKKN